MGHSAKFGTYTMFCSTVNKVVQFNVVQVITIFGLLSVLAREFHDISSCVFLPRKDLNGHFCSIARQMRLVIAVLWNLRAQKDHSRRLMMKVSKSKHLYQIDIEGLPNGYEMNIQQQIISLTCGTWQEVLQKSC